MRTRKAAVALVCVAGAAAALAAAASRITVLVLDVPERRATVVLPRSEVYRMRLLESEATLCARQGPGSPLHSVYLPADFCPLAVASSVAAPGRALLELPYLPALRHIVR
ncbi:hypothetical protein V4F39_00165 [Aquincola sp. MAHUQ-54]|uniref:Uncharacterized protein n=1 Tax=Aquincola agrisoli TaxID=3119538 RepID=A0AAW9Q4L4_9BURK